MDDLLGEDWQKPSNPNTSAPPLNPATFASNYNSFRASPQPPLSGKASPLPFNLSRPSSTVNGAPKSVSKPTTPASDAFGNLTSLKSQKVSSSLSIQERQKQILEEKRRQQEQHAQLWNTLGSGRGTPEVRGPSPAVPQSQGEDEEDILAAFNRAAPVDKASHYPPPGSAAVSGRSTPAASQPAVAPPVAGGFDEHDDPFGLSGVPEKSNGHAAASFAPMAGDEDDILGDLAKPVSERPRPTPSPGLTTPEWNEDIARDREDRSAGSEHDKALAELVDMGFSAGTAKLALAETGGDVHGAVGWLLQQAHEESKSKAKSEAQSRRRSPQGDSRSPARRQRSDQDGMPAWMRQESRSSSAARRHNNQSPAEGERDATQVASELGTKLFKSANSIWKASRKQMAKTMQDFQQEKNPSQPRWMQEPASGDSSRASSQRRAEGQVAPRRSAKPEPEVTNEAAMLDAPREVPSLRSTKNKTREQPEVMPVRGRATEVLQQRPAPTPKSAQQVPAQDNRPASKLSRQEVEAQSAQAYVSPSRRKRPTPQPQPTPEPEVDLSSPEPAKPLRASATTNGTAAPVASSRRPTPVSTPRPQAPARAIPPVSPAALATSNTHRNQGTEAFKRGDYAAAHAAYSSALISLPSTHPLTIILLSNRALTALKTGDAKVAVSDADKALALIGPSQGSNETIDLSASGEGTKQMRDFFSKALTRKAEAFEHMEKYSDAAAVWQQAVSAGVGGSVSLQGRDRCEKAARPKPAAAPVRSKAPAPGKPPPAKSLGNSQQRPALSSASSATAVKALRAANAAAEKADDEKFALTDQVDAKLTSWKGGKADNLRALLQSLDTVLWEGAGWKKVGMSDLVMPNKVKIIYMKAIAKVHPDKIPLDASTEQRMVSAAVFSTLNEAWDKFKKDNNL